MSQPYGTAFQVIDRTNAINIIPNVYGRIRQMRLFAGESKTQRIVQLDRVSDVLQVLEAKEVSAEPQYLNAEARETGLITVPHFKLNSAILPEDLSGTRAPGTINPETLARVRLQKLTAIRQHHALTVEYMSMGALKGLVLDGAGETMIDLFTYFGITQKVIDFVLGTSTTDITGKINELKRHVETSLASGGQFGQIHVWCSPEFWDKFTSHAKVETAYSNFANNGGAKNILRDDMRTGFVFQDVVFSEYNASVATKAGNVKFITDGDARGFPTGVPELFKVFYAPANKFAHVNTPGRPVYTWEYRQQDDSRIDLESQSSHVPICTRPQVLIRCHSSN